MIIIPKLPKTPKGWYSSDVSWRVPKRKKPIAYSTVATSDLIMMLSEEGLTIQEVYDKILFDKEAKMVLNEYIKRGYGNTIAKHFSDERVYEYEKQDLQCNNGLDRG